MYQGVMGIESLILIIVSISPQPGLPSVQAWSCNELGTEPILFYWHTQVLTYALKHASWFIPRMLICSLKDFSSFGAILGRKGFKNEIWVITNFVHCMIARWFKSHACYISRTAHIVQQLAFGTSGEPIWSISNVLVSKEMFC